MEQVVIKCMWTHVRFRVNRESLRKTHKEWRTNKRMYYLSDFTTLLLAGNLRRKRSHKDLAGFRFQWCTQSGWKNLRNEFATVFCCS